jgi:hypothetical protein
VDKRTVKVVTAASAREVLARLQSNYPNNTPTLSRRNFIASLGALASGTAYGADGSCEPGELSICRIPALGVPVARQTIRVTLGNSQWDVNPLSFGLSAYADSRYNDADEHYVIRLLRARYPGTNFGVDFTAVLYRSQGNWVIRLNFDAVGKQVELPLIAWMDAAQEGASYYGELEGRARSIGLANSDCKLSAVAGRLAVRIDAKFRLTLYAESGMRFTSTPFDFMLDSVTCTQLDEIQASSLISPFLKHARGPFSQIDMHGLRVPTGAFELTKVGRVQNVRLLPNILYASLIGYAAGRNRRTIFLLRSGRAPGNAEGSTCATLQVRGGACGPYGARVQLGHWAIVGDIGERWEDLVFVAEVESATKGGLALEGDSVTALIGAIPGNRAANSEVGEQIEFDLIKGTIPFISFRTHLYGAHLPVRGASSASLTFDPAQAVIVRFGDATPISSRPDSVALFEVGAHHSSISVALDEAILRIRRSADNFDLTFRLLNYHLRIERSTVLVRPRIRPGVRPAGWPETPTLVVGFSPQHLFEEAFLDADWKGPRQECLPVDNNGRPWPKERDRRLLSARDPSLAMTRLANGSRIAFTMPAQRAPAEIPLTIEWLTDWKGLHLDVDDRALPRSAGLVEQLDFVKITPATTRPDARKLIKGRITGEPDQFTTSLEPVYRLIVSPDCSATFSAPSAPPDLRYPVLWTAELDSDPRVAVRALHARGMDAGRDFFGDQNVNGTYLEDPFTGSVSANDRLQIVAMTSFYGVPALRRLVPEKPGTFEKIRSLFTDDCKAQTWKDDPNGMVFLPADAKYAYLDATLVCGLPQEGVIVAKPFDRFRLRMGRGADLDSLWHGEPPAPLWKDPFFAAALTIERYAHRIVQGRDAFVEVLYKGFLFPVGHRVSYIKLTYRDYKAYLDDPLGDPTGYLVQEFYIVCNKPRKLFRAYGQPFGSNDFPCEAVTLKTTRTPKLNDPCNATYEGSTEQVGLVGKAFWPALASGDGKTPVSFEFQIDGQAEPAHAEFMFVDNAAAHDRATMERITRYYNDLPATHRARRTVSHAGAVRRYAAETKQGDSSFKTREWLLAARGRISAVDGAEVFHMDAFMEGQDQPPFYPVVDEAIVNVESVERLTGNPGLYITAAYNANFVRHGFDLSKNPSEIYFDVISPDLLLDGNNSQGATGGVASMAALLAALSRTTGPVGGRRLPPPVKNKAPPTVGASSAAIRTSGTTASVGGSAIRKYDMAAAEAGGFDPLEYLGGAFNDAKLLGCIPLKDVLKAALITCAPKLVEQARHGVNEAAADAKEAARKIKTALLDGLSLVKKAVEETESTATTELKKQHQDLTLAGLYPELAQAMTNLVKLATDVQTLLANKPDLDLGVIQAIASDFKSGVDALLRALEAIARDPVPSIVRQKLKDLQDIWELVRDPFDNFMETLKAVVIKDIQDNLVEQLCTPDLRHLLVLLFGKYSVDHVGESQRAYCDRMTGLLRHPDDALESMRNALLYEAFSKPLFEFLQALAGGAANALNALTWSRQRVVVLITGTIRRDAAALPADRLAVAGEKIASAIEAALMGQTAPIETLPVRIDAIVKKAVDDSKADLTTVLVTLRAEFTEALITNEAAINAELQRQAAGQITGEMERTYRELLNRKRQIEDRIRDAKSLFDAIGIKWAELVDALVLEIKKEFVRAIEDQLAALKKQTKDQVEQKLAGILRSCEQALALLGQSAQMRALARLGTSLGGLCTAASTDLRMLLDAVAFKLVPRREKIEEKLGQADDALMLVNAELIKLTLRAGTPASVRDTLNAAFSTLMTSIGQVRHLCEESYELRVKWDEQWKKCDPGIVLDRAGAIVAVRGRMVDAVVNALSVASACIDELAVPVMMRSDLRDDIRTNVTKAVQLLVSLLGDITGLAQVGISADYVNFKDKVTGLTPQIVLVREKFTELEGMAQDLRNAALPPLEMAKQIQTRYASLDRYFVSLLVQLTLPENLLAKLDNTLVTLLQKLAGLLKQFHVAVHAKAVDLGTLVAETGPAGLSIATLLSPDIVAALAAGTKALDDDLESLTKMESFSEADPMQAEADLMRKRWTAGNGGIAQLARLVGKIVELVASGNAASVFINIGTLENVLKNAVKSFVPTTVELRYDFDAPLSDFPSSNPIFTMDRASYATSKEIKYDEVPEYPKSDLVLSTRVSIDLMAAQRVVKADGRIRPFTLNLLGSFDLIGISFGGAHFQAAPGERVAFDTTITGVRIGAMLEFLTRIQSYFSSGKGNGLYYDLQFLPPALEIGYRFNQPLISIGAMMLLNVGFRVGARLPLDDRQAEFFAQLSSREYPLLIVMTPYGGGGFFGLRATARGIVSFEIQLEFGFVGALAFGPLEGNARATAGIYLFQGEGTRVLEGFFHALGEGHIACFGVGVNIEIRMRQESDGAMEGTARYSFSFSVGFFEIEFEVEAHRRQENGGGGGAKKGGQDARTLLATTATTLSCRTVDGSSTCEDKRGAASILRSKALDKHSQWGRYKQHIEL